MLQGRAKAALLFVVNFLILLLFCWKLLRAWFRVRFDWRLVVKMGAAYSCGSKGGTLKHVGKR